jgi:hypothetical protein
MPTTFFSVSLSFPLPSLVEIISQNFFFEPDVIAPEFLRRPETFGGMPCEAKRKIK